MLGHGRCSILNDSNYCVFAGNAPGSHLPESVGDGEEGVREGGSRGRWGGKRQQ